MEIFQATKDGLRFISKRFTAVLVVCFISLPVLFLVSMMSRNSKFDLSEVRGVKVQNATALDVDAEYQYSRPTSMPADKLHSDTPAHEFGKGSDSKYEYSPPTSISQEKQHNGSLDSRFIGGSVSENELSLLTGIPNDNLLNGTVAPGFSERSDSRNDSSQSTHMTSDILLDGLIPPKFDEKTCIRRYQSVLYRRISPYKPFPFLFSKLRNYESLHKRCGPYTKFYNKTLRTLKSSHKGGPTECKYIVWRPDIGLGNRIVSMVSAFLYALLTSRVLLVDHGTDMTNLFCEPVPDTSWLLPMDFPLRNQFRKSEERHAHRLGGILEKNSVNISMEPTLSYLYLFLKKREYDLDKQLFYCDPSQALLQKVSCLILVSEQYFAPSFFLIPSFKEEVTKLFPEKETIFHHLGRHLFNPSNQVWTQLITRFYDLHLAKADQRIGLQIRVFHANAAQFQTFMDPILACTLKKKILLKVDTRKSLASFSKNQTSSKAILITSLYSEFYKNLCSMYLAKPAVTGELIGVYQPSQEGYQPRGDNIHKMKAWAEIYLLSLCDTLVTSAWSMFGYVAQGLGGLKSWILHKPGHGTYLPCKRAMSMEPCFHYPFSYDCKSKKKVDPGTLVPYIRQCEDRELGVKIVNDN